MSAAEWVPSGGERFLSLDRSAAEMGPLPGGGGFCHSTGLLPNGVPAGERKLRLYSSVPSPGDDPFGRADLHLHTRASDGLMSARDLVDHVARKTDLDVIAITDHDEMCGSLEAREWAVRQ